MKKIIKLLIATMLISVMAICVTACGGKTMDKVFDSEKNETKYTPYDVVYNAEIDEDYEIEEKQGAWFVLNKYDNNETVADMTDDTVTLALYNWEIQKIVWEKTYTFEEAMELDDMPVELIDLGLGAFGVVLDSETDEFVIYYGGEASQNVGKVSAEPSRSLDADLVKIGNYVFAKQDGAIKVIENETINIERIDSFSKGFYYESDEDWQKYVTVYDANLNVIGKVEVPTYANGWFETLSNGNVIMQYVYMADQQGSEYDYIAYDEDMRKDVKYFIETYIYDVEKNVVNAVETDYCIVNVTSNYTDGVTKYAFSKKVDNIAWAQQIVDKRWDYFGDIITLSLSNDGEISVIEKAFDLQMYADMDPVAGGYFFAENIAGEKVLLDDELEIVKTFGENANAYAEYIKDGDKYYTTSGTLIVDIEEEEYEEIKPLKNSVIFKDSENNAYYLLNNGALNKIAKTTTDPEEVSSYVVTFNSSEIYMVVSTEIKEEKTLTTYTIYNENGEKLLATDPTGENPDKIEGVSDIVIEEKTENAILLAIECETWNEDKEGGAGYEATVKYYVLTRKAA